MSLAPFFSVDGEGYNSASLEPESLMNFIQYSPDALLMIIPSLEFHSTFNEKIYEATHTSYYQKEGPNHDRDNLPLEVNLAKPEFRRKL
jgi:hypothetical protein